MSYKSERLDGRVIELLRAGGVGFMPSDTIYGLSCRALDEPAVERVYRLKRRDSDKPLIVLISDLKMLDLLSISLEEARPAADYWPGALTLICRSGAPAWLHRGTRSLAVRLPADEDLRKLIEQVGPIVSTSPNLQGGEPAATVAEAESYFGDQLDFYVNVGDMTDRQPSTLVKSVNGKLEVIRPGAVKLVGSR